MASATISEQAVPAAALLRIDDLTVNFGALRALDHVGFEIAAGETVSLAGENGAGKIGGNAEAAWRAGVNVRRIKLICFTLTGFTAGAGMIIYASRLQSMSSNVDGGQLILYAVAAAVIGGTSLFGGRGKMVHALLGGIVIATIYNGMGPARPERGDAVHGHGAGPARRRHGRRCRPPRRQPVERRGIAVPGSASARVWARACTSRAGYFLAGSK